MKGHTSRSMKRREGPQAVHKIFVSSKANGKELLDFLCERFTYHSKEKWQKEIESKNVLLNGENGTATIQIKEGDELRYNSTHLVEPRVPTKIKILYEDQDLLIVDKPAHLPVHPGGRYLHHCLVHLLKKQKKLKFLVLAHRLDRETSGVCVLAKSTIAKDKLYWEFYHRRVKKTYRALVWGKPPQKSGTIDAAIGDGSGKIRIKKEINGAKSKRAQTRYRLIASKEVFSPEWQPPAWPSLNNAKKAPWPISLVECQPITGRTNQIRVHLAHLGCGIIGDKLYDPDEETFLASQAQRPPDQKIAKSSNKSFKFVLSKALLKRLVFDAHALHAYQLRIQHPRTGKQMCITAPLPRSWRSIWPNL